MEASRAFRDPPRSSGPLLAAALVLAATLLAGCGSAVRVADLGVVPPTGAPTPVVFVPGVMGSRLRNAETGTMVWGKGINVVLPRDHGYAVTLPIALDDDEPPPRIESVDVVDEMRLLFVRRVVYRALADAFTANGYGLGDVDAPRAEDTLYLFDYDWRRPNAFAARRLAERLEAIRRARGEEVLTVRLICQSNGAHVCRYFLKYGGASMEVAEEGGAVPPPQVRVDRVIFVGTANGGSLRTLRELNRGRRFLSRPLARHYAPEVLFSIRSLFEDLPACRDDLFVDADGAPLPVDLYDAESWRRYGWSIYGGRAAARLAQNRRPDLFADAAVRAAYLRHRLDEARRFQRLLARDAAGFRDETRYFFVQNVFDRTPERAVLLAAENGSWRTLFAGEPELEERPDLLALTAVPGDGHATVESQNCLSPQERAVLAQQPFHSHGEHFDMILEPETLAHMVRVAAAPVE